MSASAREFFQKLADRVNGRHDTGLDDASYVFVIDGAGTWTVRVDGGVVAVSEGNDGGDCTISASEQVFSRVVAGTQNPVTAYMTGKLKINGDVGAAMKLKGLLG